MPVIRVVERGGEGEDEGEGVGAGAPVARPAAGAGAAGAAVEYARLSSNIAVADQIGRFVAGEVLKQFGNESLADKLKGAGGERMIMGSVSWG